MALDVNKEYEKLIAVANDNTIVEHINANANVRMFSIPQINLLFQVLMSTIKYPQVEPYLKDLLNNFTINELENVYNDWSILRVMLLFKHKISSNAFEMVINFGVNINIKNREHNTLAHILLSNNSYHVHHVNILNLLIKYGANLNVINKRGETVLNSLIRNARNLSEETKNCIMILIDSGATMSREYKLDNEITEFIKSYKCSNIKPAIKK